MRFGWIIACAPPPAPSLLLCSLEPDPLLCELSLVVVEVWEAVLEVDCDWPVEMLWLPRFGDWEETIFKYNIFTFIKILYKYYRSLFAFNSIYCIIKLLMTSGEIVRSWLGFPFVNLESDLLKLLLEQLLAKSRSSTSARKKTNTPLPHARMAFSREHLFINILIHIYIMYNKFYSIYFQHQ